MKAKKRNFLQDNGSYILRGKKENFYLKCLAAQHWNKNNERKSLHIESGGFVASKLHLPGLMISANNESEKKQAKEHF